jgi:hypothetical protein
MATTSMLEREHTMTVAERLLDAYLAKNQSVFVWGPPGVGKSMMVRNAARKRKWGFIDMRLNLREPVDMRGIPVYDPVTKTTLWATPSELPQVERDGEFGVLFLDEMNTASPQMMAVALGLVLDRKIGDYTLPPGWRVVAAGNRTKDKAAVTRMGTPLKDRFAHIVVKPDVASFCDWANDNNVTPILPAFLRLRPALLHVMPQGDENSFPTPRSWVAAAEHIDADKSIRQLLFAGIVGDAYATEFDGFIDLFNSLGNIADVIKNPSSAKLPENPSTRFAVSTALARMATKKNLEAIMTYVKRFNHGESETLVMHDATRRDAELMNTPTYVAWIVDNQGMTLQSAAR